MKLVVRRSKEEKTGLFGGGKTVFKLAMKLELSDIEQATIAANDMRDIMYEEENEDAGVEFFIVGTRDLIGSGVVVEREMASRIRVIELGVASALKGYAQWVKNMTAYEEYLKDGSSEEIYDYDAPETPPEEPQTAHDFDAPAEQPQEA